MKSIATISMFVAAAAAASSTAAPQPTIPSQTLNSAQAAALATLSAAQASLNAMNSQMIVNNQASQFAAIQSQSHAAHSHSGSEDLGDLDSSALEGIESSVGEETKGNGASSLAGSMLALALMAGVAMF
ncbi:hypothetical protein H4S07_004269 [Coemansia furcata]|uniref:Uncharacterized protein n=1 Tax=Coemansia furcata TaxID=417177 RepID=A0ACC1L9R0_9FUNG|nr:hypothetical protein H4S07_004269 [Coemansia furcata]KAJ2814580.1 hypothetical protein GGI24_006337 [Coemansia furcata]